MGGNQGSSIIPAMRYRDAAAAIDWLCRAFGFERHLVVPGPDIIFSGFGLMKQGCNLE